MSVVVVTSCSASGWQQYGLKFVDSFHRFWPGDVSLHIVSEDPLDIPASIATTREVCYWDLYKTSMIALDFFKRHRQASEVSGMPQVGPMTKQEQRNVHKIRGVVMKNAPINRRQPNNRTQFYSYRHDAMKFSKKVFAIELIAQHVKFSAYKRLIWLDADIVCIAPMDVRVLDTMPPDDFAIAYLDRGRYHSECGFVGYNLAHPATFPFIESFAGIYASDEVFKLQEWHDSFVFDHVRRMRAVPAYQIPHSSMRQPFNYSVLGQYMDHLKGASKQHGTSHDHPRHRRR